MTCAASDLPIKAPRGWPSLLSHTHTPPHTCFALSSPRICFTHDVLLLPRKSIATHTRLPRFARDAYTLRKAGAVLLDPASRSTTPLSRLLLAADAWRLADPATFDAMWFGMDYYVSKVRCRPCWYVY